MEPQRIQVSDPILKEFLNLWEADFKKMKKSGELDEKYWGSIKKINFEYSSKLSKKWRDKFTPPVIINHKGQYELDVLIMTWAEKKEIGVVAQFDIMNIKSKNLILELSRTYYLNKIKNKAMNRQNKESQQK